MSRRLISLITITLLGTLCTVPLSGQRQVSQLHEASANFDLEDVAPFLARVAALVDSGFSAADAKVLSAKIAQQRVDSEQQYEYSIVARGVRGSLLVRAFMDDVDAPDLYFFTHKALADSIDTAMEKYFEEVGK